MDVSELIAGFYYLKWNAIIVTFPIIIINIITITNPIPFLFQLHDTKDKKKKFFIEINLK